MSLPGPGSQFFRTTYGALVSSLCRRFGTTNLEAAEDAVQSAMLKALEIWPARGPPDNPAAWLYTVSANRLVDDLRKRRRQGDLLDRWLAPDDLLAPLQKTEPSFHADISDDLLRMLFAACHPDIPAASQLVFALKTLGGFTVSEIAYRLFSSEENVYQRLSRARTLLRANGTEISDLDPALFTARVPAVQRVLYLMFTEGFHSTSAGQAVRRELCQEALRLATLLVAHPVGQTTDCFALLALMHLLLARLDALVDASGELVLLADQDRHFFDQSEIAVGLHWLSKSTGGEFTRWHAEAGIAAEHCLAVDYASTDWKKIVDCYDLLGRVEPSPIHQLNRAIALAELCGPKAGLKALADCPIPTWLEGSFQWAAVKADLSRRAGHQVNAARYARTALDLAPSPAVAEMLRRRLATAL